MTNVEVFSGIGFRPASDDPDVRARTFEQFEHLGPDTATAPWLVLQIRCAAPADRFDTAVLRLGGILADSRIYLDHPTHDIPPVPGHVRFVVGPDPTTRLAAGYVPEAFARRLREPDTICLLETHFWFTAGEVERSRFFHSTLRTQEHDPIPVVTVIETPLLVPVAPDGARCRYAELTDQAFTSADTSDPSGDHP